MFHIDTEQGSPPSSQASAENDAPVLSAEEQMERRVDWLIRELDELCAMASNAETVDLVEDQKIAIGQMQTRVQLILSFLLARHPGKLRIVQNG